MADERKFAGRHQFAHIPLWRHALGVLASPLWITAFALTTFGTLWTITEATTYFLPVNTRGARSYAALVAASLLLTSAWAVKRYLDQCPRGLESCNQFAQRIAHLQRPKWECRFAQSLLAERVAPIDLECAEILAKRVYIPSTRIRSGKEYHQWLLDRLANLNTMSEVGMRLLLQAFPAAVFSGPSDESNPEEILKVIDSIARFYRGVVDFEKQSLATIPPDSFAHIHELQMGWSKPIRDAAIQLFEFMQRIRDLDYNASSHIQYTIEFGDIPNIDSFNSAMAEIENDPDVQREWHGT